MPTKFVEHFKKFYKEGSLDFDYLNTHQKAVCSLMSSLGFAKQNIVREMKVKEIENKEERWKSSNLTQLSDIIQMREEAFEVVAILNSVFTRIFEG